MDLKAFIQTVPEFHAIPSSTQIDYFTYYLHCEENQAGFKPKDLQKCFEQLHISPYSNIPSYLSKFSTRGKGQKFLKRGDLYFLENSFKLSLEKTIQKEFVPNPTNNLFPLSLFDNTRGYLIKFAQEASTAYDFSLYNCCFFMLRKILETLIIELFERHKIESKIKNANGGYLFLSDLITRLISEKSWHLTKIVREDIPKIKKLADASVHSKRFSATRTDIDNVKTELRIILEELIKHIDYPNWTTN